jgi:hypothetical protein
VKIGFDSRENMILKLHKGEIFKVVDKDSVDLFGTSLVQDIIDIENKSQLISRAPHIIEKLKQLSGYISPNESQIAESVSSKPDMSVLQSYFGGNNQIATNSGGASVKKQDNIQPKKNTQIAATSGGASAEQQQKIDAFMKTVTGKLKQANIQPKQDTQIASILQSYPPYGSGEQTVFISREMIPIPILMGNPGSGGMIPYSSSSNINTAFDRQFTA